MKELYEKYSLYICISLLLISMVFIYLYLNKECESKIEYIKTDNTVDNTVETANDYYVDIKGEVVNPGVYKVDSNSRLIDVVDISGGLTKNADISLLNLSKKVTDEMNIKVYSKKEVENAIKSLGEKPKIIEIIKEIEKECICPDENDACIDETIEEDNSKEESNVDKDEETNKEDKELININTASKEELMTISGIGENKAADIIEYRSKTLFNTIEDIKNVSGIGDATFNKIKDLITV